MGSSVGSLAQSAREKQLNKAKAILIFIGVLTIAVNGVQLTLAETQVKEAFAQEVAAAQRQGMIVDAEQVAELEADALSVAQMIIGGAVFVGIVFVVLGVLVKSYPVVTTVTGLVLYVGAAAVFGLIDPSTLARGAILKVVIIAFLVKAIQAAVAYQRENGSTPSPAV